MNYVKILTIACEFMAARIVFVLLCTTSVIFELIGAERTDAIVETNYTIQFTSQPEDKIVAAGQSAVFNCAIKTNYPNLTYTISWIFTNAVHDGPIKSLTRKHYIEHSNGSLILKQVKPGKVTEKKSDEGVYRCKVHTPLGTLISQPAYLKLAVLEVQKAKDQKEVNVGDTARLTCEVDSLPRASIVWKFKNKDLPIDSKKYVIVTPGVLYIRNVQISDAGDYSCFCTNPLMKNDVRSTNITLTVHEQNIPGKLSFLSPTPERTHWIRLRDKLVIECFVGKSNVVVKWMKTSAIENENEAFHSAYHTLVIPEVREEHRGNYTCVAYKESSSETISQSFMLEVGTPPRIEVPQKWVRISLISISKRFECQVRGNPPPIVKWMHNGTEVNDTRFKVLENNDLMINALTLKDAGFYQCFATNDFGTVSNAALLEFTTTNFPAPVTNLQCTPINSTAIQLSFDYSIDLRDTSSIAVKKDELNLSLDDATESDTSTESFKQVFVVKYRITGYDEYPKEELISTGTVVFDQLKPNTNYTFQVFKFTGSTTSSASEEANCSTKRVSDSLIKWRPVAVFPDTAYLHWEAEEWIHEFEVRYKEYDSNSEGAVVRTNSSRTVISGLIPKIIYKFTIIPLSDDGNMPRSIYEEVLFRLPAWLNNSTTNKIRWHQISPTSALVTWNLCQESTWPPKCKILGDLVKGFQIVYYDPISMSIRTFEAKHNHPFIIIDDLTPQTNYDVSLFIILRDLTTNVETRTIRMDSEAPPATLPLPDNLEIGKKSPFKILWNYAHDISRPLYLIAYRKSFTRDFHLAVNDWRRIDLKELQPKTEYEVKIKVLDDAGRCSNFTDVLRFVTPMLAPEAVTNMTFTSINSSTVMISWNQLKGDLTNLTFILEYYSIPHNITQIHIPGNETSVLITGLQPLMEYSVNIRAKNTAGEGPKSGVQHFHLRPIEEEKEFTLDHDQLMGVFIGCGISVFCISLCLITIFCCKRKFEKRYLEREAGVHILSGREKHEMRILTRNSMTGCKNSYTNGCGPNSQLPLLPNGIHANGYVSGPTVDNGRYCTSNGRIHHNENRSLLNADSPQYESYPTMHEMDDGDRDHEGGDSGYCDRNHSQSPQLNERVGCRERKCSDITVDDGFHENDPQLNRTSPV